ncbi:MAG: hypothetical protein EBU82_07180 [Flavobacteriia bacterium]|nr:hypothetical protein [Flavobacteriia bacterium]
MLFYYLRVSYLSFLTTRYKVIIFQILINEDVQLLHH